MKISVRIDASAFARFVDRAAYNHAPIREATEAASDVYHESMRQRFVSASSGDGAWAPLAKATVKQHAARGDAPPHALRVTGDLQGSLSRGHEDHVLETNDSANAVTTIEGTQNDVARFHQDGTSRIPARAFYVPPDDGTLAAMKEKIVEGLRESIGVKWNTP